MRPDHATAWMLYGHCLKECGLLADADAAYAEAVRLGPRNCDAVEALAHFLKITGRRSEAFHAFATAMALGAGEGASREWQSLRAPGMNPAGDAVPGQARAWIDIADLLIFLDHNRHVSGIQRVQMVLLEHALAHPAEACCITTQPWDPRIWCLSPSALRRFADMFVAGGGGTPEMSRLIREVLRTSCETQPVAGRILFQPGAFWIGGGNPPLHRAARASGMKVVPLIYDIIPVRHPQFCPPDLVREFSMALGEELHGVDAIITDSVHAGRDVAALVAEHAIPPCPVIPVTLAHRLQEGPPAPPVWTAAIAPLHDTPFVLCVGTIEPRKNHVLLLRVWRVLASAGLNPPLLVIVGKRGWMMEGFDAEMALSRGAGQRVRVMSNLSDTELDTLYSACLFTTFPSLAEGWGLPVGESLARGKVCVASNRDSMPEVGGEAAIYIDPEDLPGAVAVFRSLLFEPGALAAAEAHMRETFAARGWPEVVAEMMAALSSLPDGLPDLAGPVLPIGLLWSPAPQLRDAAPLFGPPLRLMLAEGWMQPTSRGAAMETHRAPLKLSPAERGVLRLRLHASQAMRVAVGEVALALQADAIAFLEIPVLMGSQTILIEAICENAQAPLLPPGLWLTGVELRRVGG